MNQLKALQQLPQQPYKMPVLLTGHGSRMNAIEENEFTKGWASMAEGLPKPKAILVISVHWEINGTYVTAMEQPRTIHDFYGFPQALFNVQYAAKGDALLVEEMQLLIRKTELQLDHEWGLDHGTWSVIKHLYPAADVPVLQLSLDRQAQASPVAL